MMLPKKRKKVKKIKIRRVLIIDEKKNSYYGASGIWEDYAC